MAGFADGAGVLTWRQNGQTVGVFSGAYRHGKINGLGQYVWVQGDSRGDSYVGDWRDGVFDGQGVYTWANGDRYTGGWRQGRYHGKAVHTWGDGNRYEGYYRDGRMHGMGKLTLSKSSQRVIDDWTAHDEGEWRGDVYVVEGIFDESVLLYSCDTSKPDDCGELSDNIQ